jgi:acetoin:2,6-dichlorophenolindophenol oxidoreductase subunit alpha
MKNLPDAQARKLDLFRMMVRIRCFEEQALEGHKAGEMPGPLHVSIGQEAVSAGLCINLRPTDRLTSNHRGHGHALAKGADPRRMMAELYGRADGYCGGKGGSMHLADFSVGMLGANGVVAGGIPIAVGAAQGLKLLGVDAIVVCMFGDGALNRGPFLEGFNWAALYELPVLFVCEDNGVAAFTPTGSVTAGPGAVARGQSFGVASELVDGNDVEKVDLLVSEMVSEIRRTNVPRFLHAKTYRLTGHTSTDSAAWRSAQEVTAARGREPIRRLRMQLIEEGHDETLLESIAKEAAEEMMAARRFAQDAAWPTAATAFDDVQDVGAVAWQA